MQQADALAKRSSGSPKARVDFLYETTLGRVPTSAERASALNFIGRFGRSLPDSLAMVERDQKSWAAYCQVLLQSNHFLYLN